MGSKQDDVFLGKSMTESMTTDDAFQYGLVTGEFMERQRIIALLEAELYSCTKCDRDGASLIALIKGENK